MNDPDLAAQAVAQGKLDGVVLGRPSLADPAYPQKVAMGCPQEIRPCIGCNQGCIGALKIGRRAGCAVNPQAGRESTFSLTPALEKKNVLVVGGGVAGMEAARCAALRGHTVTLCEGGPQLGGNLIPAGAHTFKKELSELNAWYQGQLAKLGVQVETNMALGAKDIRDRRPDAVVLAVGATPTVPRVEGIDSAKVIDCVSALTEAELPGQNILVVGGGLVGCETALGYAQEGKTVTLLEALPDILSAGHPRAGDERVHAPGSAGRGRREAETRPPAGQGHPGRRSGRRAPGGGNHPRRPRGPGSGLHPRPSLAAELAGTGIEVYQVGDGARWAASGRPSGLHIPWAGSYKRRQKPCERILRTLAFTPSRCWSSAPMMSKAPPTP